MLKSQVEEWMTKSGRCKSYVRYHIIFVTKYRRKCLNEIRNAVYDSFYHCYKISHIKIHKMNIDQNHIHLLVSFPVDYSIRQTINRLKQVTTNYLYSNDSTSSWLRNFYWKKKRKLWTRGYFVSTVGYIDKCKVSNYIEKQ